MAASPLPETIETMNRRGGFNPSRLHVHVPRVIKFRDVDGVRRGSHRNGISYAEGSTVWGRVASTVRIILGVSMQMKLCILKWILRNG